MQNITPAGESITTDLHMLSLSTKTPAHELLQDIVVMVLDNTELETFEFRITQDGLHFVWDDEETGERDVTDHIFHALEVIDANDGE